MRKLITFSLIIVALVLSSNGLMAQNRETGLNPGPDNLIIDSPENARLLNKQSRNSVNYNFKSVYFTEGFETATEDGALPEGWVQKRTATLNDEPVDDAITPKWFRNSASYGFENWEDYVFSGGAAMATGYTAPNFTWSISPEFTIEEGEGDINLKYWHWFTNAVSGGVMYYTNYYVKIKSDGEWISLMNFLGNDDNTNQFDTQVVQSLNAFKGKTVQLAFVYEYTDGWQMSIDDIFVGKELQNDFGLDMSTFSIFPSHGLLPTSEIAISADVFSNGSVNGATDISLVVNGNVVQTITSPELSIGGAPFFALFNWTPGSFGEFEVALQTEDDEFAGNNLVSETIYVNHYVNLAEDFENFEYDELGIPILVWPPVGWSVNDAEWVFETEQWPIFNAVSGLISGRSEEGEKALITPAVTIGEQDDFLSFYLEGVNNNVDVTDVGIQGFSTFQLKYSTSATGPWTAMGDPIPFENLYDEEENLIQSANALRFVQHDISEMEPGIYYFAFTTTSTFNLIVGETVYRSFVMVDNVLVTQDPANASLPEWYQITIPLNEVEVPYKYFIVVDGVASWDNGEWVGDPNRTVNVTGAMTVEDTWGVQPGAKVEGIAASKVGPHMVTFKVDMAEAMLGETAFDPTVHKVFIAGDFGEGFSWAQPGSNALLEMTVAGSVVPVSVNEIVLAEGNVKVFPNPASSFVSINAESTISMVEIYSLIGSKVYTRELNDNQHQINTESLENGIYIIKVTTAQGISTQKLQIAR